MNRKIKQTDLIVLVTIVCLIIIVCGIYLDNRGKITISDKDGNVISSLSLQNGIVGYDCDESVIAYSGLVFEEAVSLIEKEKELDREAAIKYIFKKNYCFKTNYDPDVQAELDKAYASSNMPVEDNTAAVISDLEGNIVACYSRGTSKNNVRENYVLYPTYAGSTMKPVSVYGPAIEAGIINWSTMIEDSPYSQVTNKEGELVDWPKNTVDYTYSGCMICDAVMKSLNTIAVKTLKMYGVSNSCDFLTDSFGMDLKKERELIAENGEDEVLANIALGYLREGVTVKDMAGFYQVFANRGYYSEPSALVSINKENETIYKVQKESKKIFSEETAFICNRLLNLVVSPDGTGASAYIEGLDVCGKTGTSDDYKDNWFVGFSPEYICAVWYGNSDGRQMNGEKHSVILFRDVMSAINDCSGENENDYSIPSDVKKIRICRKTGLAASEACENTMDGYFMSDDVVEECGCR